MELIDRQKELQVLLNDLEDRIDRSDTERSALQRQIDLIHLALQEIEHGTYGNCKECGTKIEQQRLRWLPYTRSCTKCAAVWAV